MTVHKFKYTRDLLIILVPVVIMLLLYPVLPDQIPMQWNSRGEVNWTLDRRLSFLLGLLPYVVYKLYQLKHRRT